MTTPPQDTPRRPRWLGFALLGAVVAAAALLSWILRPDDVREPVPELPATPEPALELPPSVMSLDFADALTGFALQQRCPGEGQCGTVLLWTDRDSPEEAWTAGQVPAGFDAHDQGARVIALGDCRVVLEHSGDVEAPGPDPRRWFTSDCGERWREVGVGPRGEVETIPAGGVLESICEEGRAEYEFCAHELVVTLPQDGTRTRLANPPDLTNVFAQPHPIGGGKWWVQGRARGSGKPAVAVSHDNGRTWRITEFAKPRGFGRDDLLYLTARGKDAYVVASGVQFEHGHGLQAIYHSSDQGLTWQRTWSGRASDGLEGVPIVTSYGLLLIGADTTDRRHFWLSFDHGETFADAGWDLPGEWPLDTRGGYLINGPGDPGRWYRSSDGVTWQEIAFPAG